jgi:hypothetical protein
MMDLGSVYAESKVLAMKKVENFDCFICMEDGIEKGGVEMPCCKKTFCSGCITRWLKDHDACPHCRG